MVTRDECPPRVLQDGFVIVPAQTKFHELIAVVLKSLQAEIGKIEANERVDGKNNRNGLYGSENDDLPLLGEVLIKNWNPLPIETITENRTVTVQDILGDLMNMAALQIHISK